MGVRELGGAHDLLVARLRPAVADVFADRAMQQRGVLGHHGDLRAQRFLGQAGNILAVDEDGAAFEMKEAQQQIDHGRFAGAGAADQADLLAGMDRQVEILQHAGLAAVAEIDVLEVDAAGAHRQRPRIVRIGQLQRLRDGDHALLHHADILEDLGDAHGDLARHVGELQASAAAPWRWRRPRWRRSARARAPARRRRRSAAR